MNQTNPFEGMTLNACAQEPCPYQDRCIDAERALRHYTYPDSMGLKLPPMTSVQREWCLDEISQVEGYTRQDYDAATDRDLACGVLSAWADYCRDKGLI